MVKIRRGTQEDAPQICKVHTSAIRWICSSAYGERDIDAWVGALAPESYSDPLATRVVLVAEDDGVVVGFGQLHPEAGQIEAVYVAPGQAGRGVGGTILRRLEAEARANGVRRLTLSSTLNAVTFYTGAGYRTVGPGKHRLANGSEIACVQMEKDLRSR